jgi:hypothetical protein
MRHAVVLAVVAAAAGCGSSSHEADTSTRPSIARNCLRRPVTAPQKRAYKRITNILAEMESAKTHDAESRLTDRFLLAEETSGLSAYVRNRLIDHAVASAAPKCQDCFQALEAERPIARPCSG